MRGNVGRSGVLLLSVLLLAGTASWAFTGHSDDTRAVLFTNGGGMDWRAARKIIERYGGRVDIVIPPAVLVGDIGDDAVREIREISNGIKDNSDGPQGLTVKFPDWRLVRSPDDALSLIESRDLFEVGGETLHVNAEAALRLLASGKLPRDPLSRGSSDAAEWSRNSVSEPNTFLPRAISGDGSDKLPSFAIGTSYYVTSEFLAGDIGVGILRPESTGVGVENWTAAEVQNTLTQVLNALDKLSKASPLGKTTFVLRSESFGNGVAGTVESDYEASANILNATTSALGKLGYVQDANGVYRLQEWANDIRSDLGTDWSFVFVIVDNSSDTTRVVATAAINGPFIFISQNYSADTYFHESGHIWGALDEYAGAASSPTTLAGYMGVPNANSLYSSGTGFFGGAGEGVPALMVGGQEYVSPWSRGAWGIWDLDGDGIYDPQDTFPTVTLNFLSGGPQLNFTGVATASALKRETGNAFRTTDVTINKIASVEWRLNGGPWQDAPPADGQFNASTESFSFLTPPLRNGPYVFQVRTRDNFGNLTTSFPRVLATVFDSATSNNPPMPALLVSPNLGSLTTLFAFSAIGSLDSEDSANLQFRWDYENDGIYDTAFSLSAVTQHSYPSVGLKTAKVEVRDQTGNTATRTVSFTVAAANVRPSAEFKTDKGALFGSATAIFTFDASGVRDGEDSASNLQVRWDFEDDGIWDTNFSAIKIVNHNYALRLPVTVSNELDNTYVWGPNFFPSDAKAQAFVATSDGIGRAELKLNHSGNDNTPGGTCSVGVRGSLSGPFLTQSAVFNQANIMDNQWNTFDFPDIVVTTGAIYYLVLLCSDADVMWAAMSTNPYAGGTIYRSNNGGITWAENTLLDQTFRVYGNAPVPYALTKSQAWRVRMEVKDSSDQTSQTIRDIWTNSYDTPPTVSLSSSAMTGTIATVFTLIATGSDSNSGSNWDGLLQYRWDSDGDGNFETPFTSANTRSTSYPRPGIYQATVEVRDRYYATARSAVLITVNPTSGPTQMLIHAGSNQIADVNTPVSITPSVLVLDANNLPVPGELVVFSVDGAGEIAGATAVTSGDGIATVGSWKVGAVPGVYNLYVSFPNSPQILPLIFHATAQARLTITKNGSGYGVVMSNPSGISCGETCSAPFASGVVTLTAAPQPGSVFVGWSGSGCSGTGNCEVAIESSNIVNATFEVRRARSQITSN